MLSENNLTIFFSPPSLDIHIDSDTSCTYCRVRVCRAFAGYNDVIYVIHIPSYPFTYACSAAIDIDRPVPGLSLKVSLYDKSCVG